VKAKLNNEMKIFYLLSSILFSSLYSAEAGGYARSVKADSVHTSRERKPSVSAIARIHSHGFFSYTGRMISDYPALDVYFNYTLPSKWGLNVYKAVDVGDARSYNNFLLFMINKKIEVNNRLNVNFYGGFILEQIHQFADRGSDAVANIITTYKLNRHFTFEHTGMLGNLVLFRNNADWVNRFRMIYAARHLEITGWGWHNNRVLDKNSYSSLGVSAFYNRIPVSKHITLGGGLTGLLMLSTSDTSICPKKNGLLLSITTTWHN
jgi:hypothetical protein